MPTFGRLFKEMILLTTPGKPLPRAAKGTVSGKAAFKEYEKEIEALYEGADAAGDEGGDDVAPPEDPKSPEQVAEWLGKLLASLVGHDIKDDSDVFQQGLDRYVQPRASHVHELTLWQSHGDAPAPSHHLCAQGQLRRGCEDGGQVGRPGLRVRAPDGQEHG
jgi:hypothetical protein